MLEEISITNFAIIDKLDVTFNAGMTVLTGETGAGKSIIIDAVGLLAGGRASVDFIRTGEKKAVLQGVYRAENNDKTNQALESLGIDSDDSEIIITREIQANGRNICRINGIIVNLAALKQVGETLIDIHGQNEHQELMDPEKHLGMLDQFDSSVQQYKYDYEQAFKKYQKLNTQLQKYTANEQEWNQRLDMLQFQDKEIEEAQLVPDEDKDLEQKREHLINFQAISDALTNSYQALENEDGSSASDLIGSAMNELDGIAKFEDDYETMAGDVKSAYYTVQDVTNQIRDALDDLEWNEGELDTVEQRLETIRQLKRKYGDSINDILTYHDEIKKELDSMTGDSTNLDDLSDQVQKLYQTALDKGEKLSEYRHDMAKRLEDRIKVELNQLYMEKTTFKTVFTKLDEPNISGIDQAEFYIQPNPGEDLRPLVKIASGGELSRIMLALKTIFAQSDGVTSIIFDEVDTGVSGRVAQAIADKIHDIAEFSQVLCISHLPQVAAEADNQLFVSKDIVHDRTETKVQCLDYKGRVQEIARMLAGTDVTTLSVEHADELLKMAHSK
ncbi:DNA repair protein RecN [Pediococcus argentinicus]|uniref:DNA repair protein RecN n=1 Tax=Pediococcus argentinicus TaxID=480391 RepID=UPI0033902460